MPHKTSALNRLQCCDSRLIKEVALKYENFEASYFHFLQYCFFNSLSLAVNGVEVRTTELRLRTAIELILHADIYESMGKKRGAVGSVSGSVISGIEYALSSGRCVSCDVGLRIYRRLILRCRFL